MPRKRKNPNDNWLPPRTYRGKTSYEWHPKAGGSVSLCKLETEETDQLKAKVWKLYAEKSGNEDREYTVSNMIDDYFKSPQFIKRLSPTTQGDYRIYSKKVRIVFGKMQPQKVKPKHVRAFMDKIGINHPVSANRHHSFLSVLFGWGVQYGKLDQNPARECRKFREKPRDRYVTDKEYEIVINLARKSGSPFIAPMMEIAYLCRLRAIEVRSLTNDQILPEGIRCERRKGSENEITAWSPRLKAAIEEAQNLYPGVNRSLRAVICGRNGAPVAERAYKTAWKRLMIEALKPENGLKERFTFHDLKAKGISDHNKKFGGHRDKKMQAVYDRVPNLQSPTR